MFKNKINDCVYIPLVFILYNKGKEGLWLNNTYILYLREIVECTLLNKHCTIQSF